MGRLVCIGGKIIASKGDKRYKASVTYDHKTFSSQPNPKSSIMRCLDGRSGNVEGVVRKLCDVAEHSRPHKGYTDVGRAADETGHKIFSCHHL